ncbi:ABC transporter permease subunit [bacterium]|nr:ABC transporter permease subunit [bacterium]
MFKTLFYKEILYNIKTHKFIVVFILCVLLIPLGMFVTLKDYQQRVEDYHEAIRLYQEKSEGNINFDFPAEGYRPPSLLSVFAVGLEYFFPQKVITSRNGLYKFMTESGINNPQSLLFGKIDFLFCISFVLSLMALVFTFGSISGEKETGTLRLIMASSIPRWKILMAKVLGNYVVFLIPFIMSLIIALLIINISGIISIFSVEVFPVFVVVLLSTFLFLFVMFNLGILASTLTRNSINSIISLLFIWVVFVLTLPKLSPMIAQIVYPVRSQQVLSIEKQIIRSNIEKECDVEKGQLLENIMHSNNIGNIRDLMMGSNPTVQQIRAQYDNETKLIEEKYNEKIEYELGTLDRSHQNKVNIQAAIAMNLSRISPVSCYIYFISELSGTGISEMANYVDHAERFQEQIEQEIYDHFKLTSFGDSQGRMIMISIDSPDDFDPSTLQVPNMSQYQHITLTAALTSGWIDVLLLFLFAALFFAAAFISFLKYDVR